MGDIEATELRSEDRSVRLLSLSIVGGSRWICTVTQRDAG